MTDLLPAEDAVKTLEQSAAASSTQQSTQQSSTSTNKYVTRMVQVIARHGQRSPRYILPNDDLSVWPKGIGPGELTPAGAKQMETVGHDLRTKYVDELKLFHSTYQRQDVYVRSSDVDRCLMSAHSLLHGLFPTGPTPPIHTVPQGEEFLLRGYDHCHRFHEYAKSTLQPGSAFSTSLVGDFSLFHKMERLTGVRISVQNLKPVTDSILIVDELAHAKHKAAGGERHNDHAGGFNVTGTQQVQLTDKEMSRINELHDAVNYALKSSRDMSRLMVGNLLREILERNVQYIQGIKDSMGHGPPKLTLYSAHDTTLMGLLSALGGVAVYGKVTPPTSSHMEIELLELQQKTMSQKKSRSTTTNFYIRVAYNGKVMKLGGCQSDVCPISTVAEYLNAVVPSTLVQWSLECGNTQKELEKSEDAQLFENGGYLGLDWDEWSSMAMLLSFILVLINVLFDHVVIQYFFERVQLSGTRSPASTPSRKSWEVGGHNGDVIMITESHHTCGDNACCVCCGLTRRSIVCGVTSSGFIGMCFVFLVAFGAEWKDWPSLCFGIVFLITLEATLMVGVTIYTQCLKPLDKYTTQYGRIPTDDYDDWTAEGGMSDTL